jgi:hypothetical protein
MVLTSGNTAPMCGEPGPELITTCPGDQAPRPLGLEGPEVILFSGGPGDERGLDDTFELSVAHSMYSVRT